MLPKKITLKSLRAKCFPFRSRAMLAVAIFRLLPSWGMRSKSTRCPWNQLAQQNETKCANKEMLCLDKEGFFAMHGD